MSNFALKNALYSFSTKMPFQPSQGLIQMNWRSRAEGHCPSRAWGGITFWPRVYTKKYSIRCQILRSKTRHIVFKHKSLFNLVKDLFKWIEGLVRSVNVRVQFEVEKNFWPRWHTKKVLDTLVNFALKNALYSVSTKMPFQPSQGLIQMNWGSREKCHCLNTAWGWKNFWHRWHTKNSLIRCQISRSKRRYIVFQHKSLFNLVKDLFKWIEGLGRRVTVRVESEGELIFDLGGIQKKYSIRCQISRSKTRHTVFKHKSLFNLVKDLFKWIEGLARSVNVRVQF